MISAVSAAAFGLGPVGGVQAVGPTTVTYTGSPNGGSQIAVEAALQTSNLFNGNYLLLPAIQAVVIVLEDEAGIVAPQSPHCTQESTTKVHCDATGLRRLDVDLGDGADSLGIVVDPKNPNVAYAVDGGPGDDVFVVDIANGSSIVVHGGGGNDDVELEGSGKASGQSGDDRLIGKSGDQLLVGGTGRDILIGGQGAKDHCNGGPNRDAGGRGCDRVVSIP